MKYDPMAFSDHTLPGGLRVRWQRRRDLDWFGCTLMVHAGSRDDPPGKPELAHLLEHLLSAGTQGMPRMTLVELERWLAAQRFVLDLGSTHLDFMSFSGKAPCAKDEAFLRLLRDIVLRPTLDSDLDKERDIIRREREEHDTPEDRASLLARGRAFFGEHPLSRVNGWAEDDVLDGLTLEDARTMHARHFDPANMTLLVSGGISEDRLLKLIEPMFAGRTDFVRPERIAPPPIIVPEPRERVNRKESGRVSRVGVSYEWILPPARNGATRQLVSDALQHALSDRIREKLRATYAVDVDFEPYMDHCSFALETTVTPKRAAQVREIIDAALRESDAVAADVERLRDEALFTLDFLEFSVDEALERAEHETNAYGGPRTTADVVASYNAVTADDVRELMAALLSPERAYIELTEE